MALSSKIRNEERLAQTLQKGGSNFFVSIFEREPHGPSDVSNALCVTVFMKPCT